MYHPKRWRSSRSSSPEFLSRSALAIVLIVGGLGGVAYGFGIGPFRKFVSPLATIILVLWIVNSILTITGYLRDGKVGSLFLTVILPITTVGVVEALYVVGYFLARDKK